MTQTSNVNRKFVLAQRPRGAPDDNTLRLETEDIATPGKGEMLLRNEYLSLDPYMRIVFRVVAGLGHAVGPHCAV